MKKSRPSVAWPLVPASQKPEERQALVQKRPLRLLLRCFSGKSKRMCSSLKEKQSKAAEVGYEEDKELRPINKMSCWTNF